MRCSECAQDSRKGFESSHPLASRGSWTKCVFSFVMNLLLVRQNMCQLSTAVRCHSFRFRVPRLCLVRTRKRLGLGDSCRCCCGAGHRIRLGFQGRHLEESRFLARRALRVRKEGTARNILRNSFPHSLAVQAQVIDRRDGNHAEMSARSGRVGLL